MKLSPSNTRLATVDIGETLIDYVAISTAPAFRKAYNDAPAVFNYLKYTTPTTVASLHRQGKGLLLIAEWGATDATHGMELGKIRGADAARQALALGYPHDCPLVPAVDYDIDNMNLSMALNYVAGFQTTCEPYPVMPYADADFLMYWQGPGVQISNSFSHGRVAPNASFLQHYPQSPRTFDTDVCLKPCTVWLPHLLNQPPYSIPATKPTEELDMFYNIDPFTYAGITYPGGKSGPWVYWRYNDAGIPVHITTTEEVVARGGHAAATGFNATTLSLIPNLPS